LHSNASARRRAKIDFLPLSLHPFNLHHHEGHELSEPVDINPANATNSTAESFLQDVDHVYTSYTDSSNFSAVDVYPRVDSSGSSVHQSPAAGARVRSASGLPAPVRPVSHPHVADAGSLHSGEWTSSSERSCASDGMQSCDSDGMTRSHDSASDACSRADGLSPGKRPQDGNLQWTLSAAPGSSAASQGTTGFGVPTAGSGAESGFLGLQTGSGSSIVPGFAVAGQSMVVPTSLPKRQCT
jgi:hypothetical protein